MANPDITLMTAVTVTGNGTAFALNHPNEKDKKITLAVTGIVAGDFFLLDVSLDGGVTYTAHQLGTFAADQTSFIELPGVTHIRGRVVIGNGSSITAVVGGVTSTVKSVS